MNYASDAFVAAKDVPVEIVGDGIKRQILAYSDSLMVTRVEFQDGAAGDVHAHRHSQVTYVESGEFHIVIDGESRLLGPGDSVCIQPNLDHGAICKKAGVLLDVFSPVREDFLDQDGTP